MALVVLLREHRRLPFAPLQRCVEAIYELHRSRGVLAAIVTTSAAGSPTSLQPEQLLMDPGEVCYSGPAAPVVGVRSLWPDPAGLLDVSATALSGTFALPTNW